MKSMKTREFISCGRYGHNVKQQKKLDRRVEHSSQLLYSQSTTKTTICALLSTLKTFLFHHVSPLHLSSLTTLLSTFFLLLVIQPRNLNKLFCLALPAFFLPFFLHFFSPLLMCFLPCSFPLLYLCSVHHSFCPRYAVFLFSHYFSLLFSSLNSQSLSGWWWPTLWIQVTSMSATWLRRGKMRSCPRKSTTSAAEMVVSSLPVTQWRPVCL